MGKMGRRFEEGAASRKTLRQPSNIVHMRFGCTFWISRGLTIISSIKVLINI